MELDTMDKYIIRSGSFLHASCPHCDEELNRNNHIVFEIVNMNGERGILKLSPYLNVFTNESTVHLPEKMSVRDIKCPLCGGTLIIEDERCPECKSRIARIGINAVHRGIDFYFCSKKGCRWHGLKQIDYKDIALEDSDEW